MRIIELFEDGSADYGPKMFAILKQLEAEVTDTNVSSPINLDAIIKTLDGANISITKKEFKDLFNDGEFKDIIANIKGDNVTFIGQSDEESDDIKVKPETDTLKKMAKRATKKRD